MITASIVAFHTKHDELKRLLDCALTGYIDRLFIIDNSSNDELRDFVKDNDKVNYIHSLNLGYGSGHNVAIRKSIEMGADYHVVLNPDIYWNDNVIERLCEFMDANSDCGLVMPKIVYPSGETQHLCKLLPSPMDLIGRRFIPIKSYQKKHDYQYELHWTGYDSIMEVPSLSGCFMFMRCSVLKHVGGFDERYFMYAEDLDLCRRIGEVSRTMFYPNVVVVHEYEKGSYKSGKLLKYHVASIVKYFNKWGWIFDRKRIEKNRSCIEQLKRIHRE
ncbi:glycosyltransferase family 2 protein [Muribaculum sp. NM65_B17]|uniref:glycosyltransferase family 2 protein n=1 Tax=Muribaculum sp. NM65_B17 TaxID=2516961 RepID=UPI00109372B2|nr:glycosyltransferase family 2 protein [Muribaculum sp. NM65_B17]TGY02987.1 glycosyltransferase family 2 protein [Muribaculum sp. NM65_B17]THG41333.1 glycosyltransferase family 2 protein [Muribaculaceae bacterium]